MREVWLHSNRRAQAFGLAVPLALLIAGLMLVRLGARNTTWSWLPWPGWGLVALGGVMAGMVLHWLRLPRLAYQDGSLLVYLRYSVPYHVPIEVVECFLLGQAPSMLPGRGGKTSRSATVLIRLADSAPQWHERDVKAALGSWCDGYITLRGTWCERLHTALLQRLNQRLAEVKRVRDEDKGSLA